MASIRDEARAVGGLVRDEARADVGVDHGDAGGGLARHERLVGGGAGFGDEADAAEEERVDGVGERGEGGGVEHPARGAFVVEGVARLPVHEADEGERGGAGGAGAEAGVDVRGGQRRGEEVAEEVGREAAEVARARAEAAERDGGVEDGAARVGGEGVLALGVRRGSMSMSASPAQRIMWVAPCPVVRQG